MKHISGRTISDESADTAEKLLEQNKNQPDMWNKEILHN